MVKYFFHLLILWISIHCPGQYATSITVARDGTGDFQSIQEAIHATKAFPEEDIIIYIKKGTYTEKVRLYAWNNRVSLIGESRDSTIITWADHFDKIDQGRNSTFLTYTLQVESNDVSLQNLTILNTAGPVGQAVALHIDGDRVQVINCTIQGNQDTAYLAGENARQYFKNCLISGTTDFIFGEATAVFENCKIVSLANSYITAASTLPQSAYGFVFINCHLTAKEGISKVFLGRPWRSFAKTAFINCKMDAHILPEGWNNWNSSDKEKTVTYAEYSSSGPGGKMDHRVSWAKDLTKQEAKEYTINTIFGNWVPRTTAQ